MSYGEGTADAGCVYLARSANAAVKHPAFAWAIVLIVGVAVAGCWMWTRWSAHVRHVSELHSRTVASARLSATYRTLTARIEARRVYGNELINRFHSAMDHAQSGGLPALSPARERLEALRRGDRFDDIISDARRVLPPNEVRALDHDFTVLIKRQEDARDQAGTVSASMQAVLTNPFFALAFGQSAKDMWKRYFDSRRAYNDAFETMQRDVYDRARDAAARAKFDKLAEQAARSEPLAAALAGASH